MKKINRILCSILLALSMFAVAACGGGAKDESGGDPSASGGNQASADIPDEINIGVVSAISGPMALEGKFVSNAITMMNEDLEEIGGLDVQGKKVKVNFIHEDCEGKPEITVSAYQKLINQNNVMAIVGPPSSSQILAAGPIAQSADILAITPMGTNEKITQIGDYIFRACFIDSFQAEIASNYLLEQGFERIAIFYSNAEDYSTGLKTAFVEVFEEMGGTVIEQQAYAGQDAKDYNAQWSKIKESDPQAVFMPIYYQDIPLALQQARQAGVDCLILGTDSWDTPEVLELAGADNLQNVQYISAFSAQNPDPKSMEFSKRHIESFGDEPNSNCAYAYESMGLVLNAISNAPEFTPESIRDTMAATKDYDGVTGLTTFDENRNPVKSALILQFASDGQVEYVTTIDP